MGGIFSRSGEEVSEITFYRFDWFDSSHFAFLSLVREVEDKKDELLE